MNFRIGQDEPAPPVNDDDAPVRLEMDRMPAIEEAYGKHLEPGTLAPNVERNVGIYQADIAAEFAGQGADAVREAWALHRSEEPQPEDHRFSDQMQLDYAVARNVAFARVLDSHLVAEGRQGLRPAEVPEPAPLRPEPLMLEKLRELRAGNPLIEERVARDKAALATAPGLESRAARESALTEVQGQMRAAVDAGDKSLERQLRIRVLALDDLVKEQPSPRPLPPAEALTPSAAAQGNLSLDEPTERLPPRAPAPGSSAEQPPIHRRASLGLPPAINNEPTTPQRPGAEDTLPMPPRQRPAVMSTPSEPEGAPIHRLSVLQAEQLEQPLHQRDTSLLDEFDVDDDMPTSGLVTPKEMETMPARAGLLQAKPRESSLLDALDEASGPHIADPSGEYQTRPGRNRVAPRPGAPADFAVEPTREVSLGDIVVDEPEFDTQKRFDSHFKMVVDQGALRAGLRGDLDWADSLRRRANDADPDRAADAQADLKQLDSRIDYFKQRHENAAPGELLTQYSALRLKERGPDDTGEMTPFDRLALASLQHHAERRQAALANRVADDLLTELRATPWELDEARGEAMVLMASQERAFDEYPYTDRAFLASELLRSYETEPEYARVCALMLHAQRAANTSYLLYEIEQDKPAYDAAQQRVPGLLQRPSDEVDRELMSELAQARLAMVLARDEASASLATARARQAALIYDVLPGRRAEMDTGPMRSRMPV